jgi:hypothetical protein
MRGLGATREAGRHRCEHCNERKARQTTLHSHLRVELAPPYSNDRARDLDCRLGCYASGQDYDVWFAPEGDWIARSSTGRACQAAASIVETS